MDLWPAKAGSEAAGADPRRLASLERVEVDPGRPHSEHHDVERYVVFP